MTNKWELFQKFLITQEEQIQVPDFIINSILILVLAWLLAITYNKCGKSLSNRKSFSSNFILVGFATMLIISIVKSSLALSLGLVGALSIIRFRAAIKEPEELSYLFIVISMGLGLGANLRLITLVAFLIIISIIWIRYFIGKPDHSNNLFLTIRDPENKTEFSSVEVLLKKYFKSYQLKRLDNNDRGTELAFMLEAVPVSTLDNFKKDLIEKIPSARISIIDNKIY
jgi:hypothetical protein